jgi:hypothetical protein
MGCRAPRLDAVFGWTFVLVSFRMHGWRRQACAACIAEGDEEGDVGAVKVTLKRAVSKTTDFFFFFLKPFLINLFAFYILQSHFSSKSTMR